MLQEVLSSGFEELNIDCGIESLSKLRVYYDFLEESNKVMNLTAISGEDNVAKLHFLDSAALLSMADFSGKKVLDVGTGAGFPGMVLKIVDPSIKMTLMESLEKRVNFLRSLCEKLGIKDVDCIRSRAEEAPAEFRESFDIVTSRAVAKLAYLSELCIPFVKVGGLFIAMKGPAGAEELQEARRGINVLGAEYVKTVSYPIPGTDKHHNALIFKKVADTPEKYPRRWAQIKKQPL